MELKQYKAEHMNDLVDLTDQDKLKFAVSAEASAFAYSVMDEGRCVGCAGILNIYSKVFYMWAIVGEDLRKNRLWLHRMVRRYLPLWLDNCDWVRVEAMVEAANKRDCRWVENLGFKFESLKACGGNNGGDALVYAKVKT